MPRQRDAAEMMTLGNMHESHGVRHNVSDCHRGTGKG